MIITMEMSLERFNFWSGAADRVVNLTSEDFAQIESELEQLYPDGIDETQLNDIFWFDFDWIAQILGYENEEDFDRKRDPDYVEPEERKEWITDQVAAQLEEKYPDYYDSSDVEKCLDYDWDEDSDDEGMVANIVKQLTDMYEELSNEQEDDE